MVQRRTLGLAAALLLLAAAPARAQEDASGGPDYSRAGYYAAFGPSFTLDSRNYRDGTAAYGFGLRVGRRFSKFASGEVQLEWIDDNCNRQCGFRDNPLTPTVNEAAVRVGFTTWTITANLRGYPNWDGQQLTFLDGRLQPFVLIGMGAVIVDPTLQGTAPNRQPNELLSQNTRFGLRLGTGIEAHYTENLSVVLDASWLGGIRTGKRGREKAKPLFTDIQYGSFILALQYRY